jgi:hypothetical protein
MGTAAAVGIEPVMALVELCKELDIKEIVPLDEASVRKEHALYYKRMEQNGQIFRIIYRSSTSC